MKISEIDKYIDSFPKEIRQLLTQVRMCIKKSAPDAEEKISWGMPTFTLNGNLVHYAAMKKHIGFYPSPQAIEKFKEKLTDYKTSKGAIQFPYERPIPFDLIAEIVKFRVAQNKNITTRSQ